MYTEKGKCIKCGRNIRKGQSFGHLYQHLVFELSTGSRMAVAICPRCEILESEWPEIMSEFNSSMRAVNKKWKDEQATISSQVERIPAAQLILEAQEGNCFSCGKIIDGKYVLTNNSFVLHESCNFEKPVHVSVLNQIVDDRLNKARLDVQRQAS